jgi:energy-coupling factor transport system permease protein
LAWWIWALGLAVTAGETTNPVLLLLLVCVLGLVIANRRGEAPWARAFKYYLYLALVVVGIRVVFRAIFGGDVETTGMHVLVVLPHVPLPSWAAGVQLGGPVTLEGTLSALYGGLRLACLLCCIGAANALANPKRALRLLPGALYELGVAVVVSISVAPQLIESLQRVRRARKLRGGARDRWHGLRSTVIPVLEDALERSLRLAAAMDSRGYGRTSQASPGARRATGYLMVGGMAGLCLGTFGLLDGSVSRLLGFPTLVAGAALCGAGLFSGSRRVARTTYRPDPWSVPEWVVAAAGLLPAAVLLIGAGFPAAGLNPSVDPLTWPTVPVVPAIAIVAAAIAAVAAPPPVRAVRRTTVSPVSSPPRHAASRPGTPEALV